MTIVKHHATHHIIYSCPVRPAEALRIANQALAAHGLPAQFVLHFTSPDVEAATSVGVQLTGLTALPEKLPTPAWVVLVGQPGNTINVTSVATRALLHWLRGLRLKACELELVTVCAGAVLGAHACLLKTARCIAARASPPVWI